MKTDRQPLQLDDRIARALQILLRDPSRALDVGELALAAELSVAHFRRLFRQETGTTPARLLKGVRLERAHTLITATGQEIKKIVGAAGFSDIGDFVRDYRRRYGGTPSQVRQRQPGR